MSLLTAHTGLLGGLRPGAARGDRGGGQVSPPAGLVDRAAGSVDRAAVQGEVMGLFDGLRSRLLRYAMSFGLSMQDGEDVLQEVFLALYRHLMADGSRENLAGWAFRTTHHLSLKRRASLQVAQRREHAGDESGAMEWTDGTPGPEEDLLLRERQQRLQRVLRALPAVDQQCLELRAEGLRYREIASAVGISLGSVAASLARSFDRLQRMDAR